MKSSKSVLAILALCGLLGVSAAQAETISYNGTSPPLQDVTVGTSLFPNSLAPAATSPSGNTVNVDYASGVTPASVFGGYSSTGLATNNTVNVSNTNGGTKVAKVYGGYSLGDVIGNAVTISGGDVTGTVYGAEGKGTGLIKNNTLTIDGGNFTGANAKVYGAVYDGRPAGEHVGASEVSGNKLILRGNTGAITQALAGENTGLGIVKNNEIFIYGGSFENIGMGTRYGDIYINAGYVRGGGGNSEYNKVTIDITNPFTYTVRGTDGGRFSIGGGYAKDGGSAIGNEVHVKQGTFNSGPVGFTGALLQETKAGAEVRANKVTIENGNFGSDLDISGGIVSAGDGNSVANTIAISGGTFTSTTNMYAGKIDTPFLDVPPSKGVVSKNIIDITGGTFSGATNIYAGFVADGGTGSATNNTVNISNATFTGATNIYGAKTKEASAIGNIVNFNATLSAASNVYGGMSSSDALVKDNVVNILGGSTRGKVYGGYSYGDLTGNSVVISGGTINGTVQGAEGKGTGALKDNMLIIDGGNFVGANAKVYGALFDGRGLTNPVGASEVSGNKLIIRNNGGVITQALAAENTGKGTIKNNELIIEGGTYAGINGGNGLTYINGGYVRSGGGNSEYNRIIIREKINYTAIDGQGINFTAGSAIGGGDAIGNEVIVSKGTFSTGASSFTAGSLNQSLSTSVARDNTVVISSGVYGSAAEFLGASITSGDGTALRNSVNIIGGEFTAATVAGAAIQGGRWNTSMGTPFLTGNGDLRENVVNIYGGKFIGTTANIYGGIIMQAEAGLPEGSGNVVNNVVNVMGTPDLRSATLYGGYSYGSGEVRRGNTLNVYSSGLVAKNIANFQNYYFAMSTQPKTTVLTLTGTENTTFATGDKIKVLGVNGSGILNVGHSNTLLQRTGGSLVGLTADMLPSGQIKQGPFFVYDYSLTQSADAKSVVATITGRDATPEGKVLSESHAARMSVVTQGADVAVEKGINSAVTAARSSKDGMGVVPFAALSASSLRYNTGSHVNTSGTALIAGFAKRIETSAADVFVGAFFDAAFAGIKTHNSVNGGSMDGTGSVNTLGAGLLGRVNFSNGLYGEASFRIGQVNSQYNNSDLRDASGANASYDLYAAYYSAHAGLGYIWQMSDKASLDMYGKFLWAQQKGGSATVLSTDLDFEDVNSIRIRAGARFSYKINENVTPYVGAAFEHEFDGKARATAYGIGLPNATMQGSTGFGELGLVWTPKAESNFAVELGVQGYVGQKEGVSGSLLLKYEF